MTFRVIKETNTWDRWGAKVNARERTVLKTENLEEAWRYHRTHNDPMKAGATKAERHHVVTDDDQRPCLLIDLYRQEIGEQAFQEQLHRPGFSINMDTWLADRIERNAPLSQETVIDEWLDHDEGVRVIQTPRGHRYEAIRKKRRGV